MQCPLVHIWNFCFKEPETVSQQSWIIYPLVASLHGMKKYRDETLHYTHLCLLQGFLKINQIKIEGSVFAPHNSVSLKHLLLEPSVFECFFVAKKMSTTNLSFTV